MAYDNGHVIEFSTPTLASGYYNITCTFDSDVSYTVEETFLVYNKSSISYTSINPHFIDIDTAETAVITGSGFVNTSDIACVSRDRHVFKAKFVSSTSVSCSVPPTKDSVQISLAVSFSRGDREIGESALNFTIYANESKPVSAKFLNNLKVIEISFNLPTKSREVAVSCSAFFPQGNASSFGARSKCFFGNSRQMIIQLQDRPSIVPNDTLRFRLNSITRRYQKITKEPRETYYDLVVAPPDVPVTPVAKVGGVEVLGECLVYKIR